MSQNTARPLRGAKEIWWGAQTPHKDSQVNIVLHQSHTGVTWPTLLVIVADNVLVVGVRMFCEVALDEVPSLLC